MTDFRATGLVYSNPQPWWNEDYFRGYRSSLPHPMMTSTGSEGRCDICGSSAGYVHQPPYQRISYEQYLAEKWADRPADRPIRPLFAWERGEPRGAGSAGEYVRHVRENRRQGTFAFDPGHTKTGTALDFGYAAPDVKIMSDWLNRWRSGEGGLKRVAARYFDTKEDSTMKLDLTIEAADAAALVQAVLDIKDAGIEVTSIRNPVVAFDMTNLEPPLRPLSPSVFMSRYCVTDTPGIVRYLTKVCDHNAPLESGQVEVEVEYVAQGTEERSTRTIQPVQVQGNYLTLLDLDDGEKLKTFLIDRIESVEGPSPVNLR